MIGYLVSIFIFPIIIRAVLDGIIGQVDKITEIIELKFEGTRPDVAFFIPISFQAVILI